MANISLINKYYQITKITKVILKISPIEEIKLLTIILILGLCVIIFKGLKILITLIILMNDTDDYIILKSKIAKTTIIKSNLDHASLK